MASTWGVVGSIAGGLVAGGLAWELLRPKEKLAEKEVVLAPFGTDSTGEDVLTRLRTALTQAKLPHRIEPTLSDIRLVIVRVSDYRKAASILRSIAPFVFTPRAPTPDYIETVREFYGI